MRAERQNGTNGRNERRVLHETAHDPILVLDRRQQRLERMDLFPVTGETIGEKKERVQMISLNH